MWRNAALACHASRKRLLLAEQFSASVFSRKHYATKMTSKTAILAGLAALLVSPALAQDDTPPVELSDQQIVQINLAASRGVDIYRYDAAAWQTTDTMIEDLADEQLQRVRGWVVVEQDNGLRVTYFGGDESEFVAIYSATFGPEGVIGRTVHSVADSALNVAATGSDRRATRY